ncbi:hypothetical protein Shewana3_3195 [Shewanella sp. ANA-3]|uniref:hypothetical protein n=1 Tax=Shewanella sp. (strain ANA-3) TaxID=94122 RepID=UPI00005DE5F5|nr:hypothetical protein [Shewanella sp. ANA-3]ABK49419.1 hypothetical protein Shewana3_3195 [Shewanella sp. ANA-3]
MSFEQEFTEKVGGYLDKLTDKLQPVLKQLIGHDYPQEVVTLAFEVFVDGFSSQFPVRVFFMDIDGKVSYASSVNPHLLDIDHVYPDEFEEEYIEKDEDLDPWHIATNELIEWFSKCWIAAGGQSFKLKANIAPHDSHYEFNLVECQWQERC